MEEALAFGDGYLALRSSHDIVVVRMIGVVVGVRVVLVNYGMELILYTFIAFVSDIATGNAFSRTSSGPYLTDNEGKWRKGGAKRKTQAKTWKCYSITRKHRWKMSYIRVLFVALHAFRFVYICTIDVRGSNNHIAWAKRHVQYCPS